MVKRITMTYTDHTAATGFNFLGKMDNLSKNPDFILFTGGADVNPNFYGQIAHPFTAVNEERDKLDLAKFTEYASIPKVGICRGSQFLTVMAGGRLIQHVTGHAIAGTHQIETFDDKKIHITSTHHQMMYPWDVKNHYLLGYSYNLSNTYQGENGRELFPVINAFKENKAPQPLITEPEIVYYPKIKALCIQGHPEYYNVPKETKDYVKFLVTKLVNDELEDYIWAQEEA